MMKGRGRGQDIGNTTCHLCEGLFVYRYLILLCPRSCSYSSEDLDWVSDGSPGGSALVLAGSAAERMPSAT
jgi:hypothetical protein